MEYISIKELVLKTQIAKMTFCRWCNLGKINFRYATGIGGKHYEILVSSLPVDIQKKIADKSAFELGVNANCNTSPHPNPLPQGEGVTKSPLEIGVNAGGYQFAEAQKETDVPTAAQATAQGSLNNKTGGVYPDSISKLVINSNNAGFSLKSNALTPTAQPPLTLGGNADCNASPHPNPLPFTRGEGADKSAFTLGVNAGKYQPAENDEKTNVIIETNLQESCALTEEQAQTLISFGLLSKEKEVKSATEIQKKKALAWVDLIELWYEYRSNKSAQEWSVESEVIKGTSSRLYFWENPNVKADLSAPHPDPLPQDEGIVNKSLQ